MYFGELALLRGEARAATVLAAGDCDLLALERAEFMRVMGPLAAQLEQQAAKYAGIASVKQARPGFRHADISHNLGWGWVWLLPCRTLGFLGL